jgi:L-ascorbate metabolism protein UlaG (beta-lactamase superfamily)
MKKASIVFLMMVAALLASCSKEDSANVDTSAGMLKSKSIEAAKCPGMRHINEMVKNIHWIEQACIKIEKAKMKIYIDPLAIQKTDKANIILITHTHGDHYSIDDINKATGPNTLIIGPADCNYTGSAKFITLKPGESYKTRNVKIKAVPAYNVVKTDFHPKSNNWVGYLITIDGVTIYHAGDTERIYEMKDFSCDIALLPLGQVYTMNSVEEAAEAAKDVKAKIAIPIHYGLYEGTAEDALKFKSLLEGQIKVVIKNKGE